MLREVVGGDVEGYFLGGNLKSSMIGLKRW